LRESLLANWSGLAFAWPSLISTCSTTCSRRTDRQPTMSPGRLRATQPRRWANTFLEEGVAVVVAEGSFNAPDDRAAFARHLDTSVDPIYVTLRVSFEEALRRAQSDPTRGRSSDPAFLSPYFDAVDQALAAVPATDIVIDTEAMPATSAAVSIVSRVGSGTSN
jgi:hypothetical protein